MSDFIDIVGDKDVPERVHLHTAAATRTKDAVDGKTPVAVCIRGLHTRRQIWTLRPRARRHGGEATNRCHGIRQRNWSLRFGVNQG